MADWSLVKDLGVPTLTGVVGILGTVLTLRNKSHSDDQMREAARQSLVITTQAAKDQAQMSFDASTAQTLTERFKALMDGYEHMINGLQADLKEAKERRDRAENQLQILKNICGGCEEYRAYLKDHPNAFSAPA